VATEAWNEFRLKREIDIGQVLTIISIVGSVIAFFLAWGNDKALKDKEYADRIRKSAAAVTAKIERWSELSDRYFEDLQPTLVDVSEKVAETNARQPANRILFRGLMDAKGKASQRIVDEQLQGAYMELYGYVPQFQGVFDTTIERIKSAERESQQALRLRLQDILLDKAVTSLKDSPSIGNVFRSSVEEERVKLQNRITQISRPLREKMLKVIQLKDGDLRNAQETPVLTAIFASSAPADGAASQSQVTKP